MDYGTLRAQATRIQEVHVKSSGRQLLVGYLLTVVHGPNVPSSWYIAETNAIWEEPKNVKRICQY